jgi:hypothetical protein
MEMTMRSSVNRGMALTLALALLACESTAPTTPESDVSPPGDTANGGTGGASNGSGTGGSGSGVSITFLSTGADAPALAQDSVAFYAVQGEDREVEIDYASSGGSSASRFLRFKVRHGTQIVLPNGTELAEGDSVLITITVPNPTTLLTKFEPAGLRFVGGGSARLNLSYIEVDDDLNGDGLVNAADSAIEQALSLFRRESSGAPWIKVSGTLSTSLDEIEAEIGGFTNYVIAY